MNNPNIFISYSHDNGEHEAWVLKLASDLRSHGINAILDQWDLQLGADLRFFMESGLSNSNFILCICSENYVKKVNSGIGGAGYEGMIMTQSLLQNAKSESIISIVRNNPSANKVPLAFVSKLYIDFSDDSQYVARYQELLERIYGEDSKKKPPLGENPFAHNIAHRIENKMKFESIQYHSPEMDGKVVFRFDNNNGIYLLGNGEYLFETKWIRSGNNNIHVQGLIGFNPNAADFPTTEELVSLDYSSNHRTIKTGQVIVFENSNNHFAAVKLGTVKSSCHGYPYDEIIFEYHIYDTV